MLDTEEEILMGDYPTEVDPVFHIAGTDNVADLATRGAASVRSISSGSVWQDGPSYLQGSRKFWPISRQFLRQIPTEEQRNKFCNLVSDLDLKNLMKIGKILYYSDSLDKVRGILARIIKASGKMSREAIENGLTVKDYEKADHLMMLISMRATVGIDEKVLNNLAPFWSGFVMYTRGRLGPNVARLLGPEKLPILSPDSRLAKLIMIKAHSEAHMWSPGDALFRSRKYAWIVRGRRLAKQVVKECLYCNVLKKKLRDQTEQQQMGDLPDLKFEACKPFTNICIDLAGPYQVVDSVKKRTKMKVYPVLFCCINTGAVDIRPAEGQDTSAFLTQYEGFVSIRGRPKFIYSDKGSNLKRASKHIDSEEDIKIDWEKIKNEDAKHGTDWRFAPAGSQWRDGIAENRVKLLKRTLPVLTKAESLTYAEYAVVLSKVANIMNNRPLGVEYKGGEGELVSITPNTLLMAGSNHEDNDEGDVIENKYVRRKNIMNRILTQWWDQWYAQVFSSLFPYNKWKEEKENLEPGDVCLLKYEKKIGKGDYRLCKVETVEKDLKGLVRTVEVLMRPRDSREKSLPYKSKQMVKMKVPVQRLVLIEKSSRVQEILKADTEAVDEVTVSASCTSRPDYTSRRGFFSI